MLCKRGLPKPSKLSPSNREDRFLLVLPSNGIFLCGLHPILMTSNSLHSSPSQTNSILHNGSIPVHAQCSRKMFWVTNKHRKRSTPTFEGQIPKLFNSKAVSRKIQLAVLF